MNLCRCGKELLIITDRNIIGHKAKAWHVCPLVLYGFGTIEHDTYWKLK
jgi:hypothetical protein